MTIKIELKPKNLNLLGDERECRRLMALSSLVAAETWTEESAKQVHQVAPILMDALELRLQTATGGRERTLLEAYDLVLAAIEQATSNKV
jgi:hypothetical protein